VAALVVAVAEQQIQQLVARAGAVVIIKPVGQQETPVDSLLQRETLGEVAIIPVLIILPVAVAAREVLAARGLPQQEAQVVLGLRHLLLVHL
jgi:hypothetical protein